jgi:phage major head subunit gpT-like protein
MIVDKDFLAGARTVFTALYDQVQGKAENFYAKFATVIPVDKLTVTVNWLGAPAQMRPVKGTLDFSKTFPHDYTVTVTNNAVGVAISEESFKQNPLDQIGRFLASMMVQASRYYDKICSEKLSSGFATTDGACFDAKAFYADDHSIGDAGTYDNKAAANLTAGGTEYQAGWAIINAAKDDQGQPMGLVPSVLVVHSANRKIAKELLGAAIVAQTSNVLVGDVELVVSPFLNNATAAGKEWHLLAGGAVGFNPIVLFEEEAPKFIAHDDPSSSDAAFRDHQYWYKIQCYAAPAYGDPRQAYGSTGT